MYCVVRIIHRESVFNIGTMSAVAFYTLVADWLFYFSCPDSTFHIIICVPDKPHVSWNEFFSACRIVRETFSLLVLGALRQHLLNLQYTERESTMNFKRSLTDCQSRGQGGCHRFKMGSAYYTIPRLLSIKGMTLFWILFLVYGR